MHPDIFMSKHKEPAYFVKELNLSKGIDWYLSLFADAKDEKYIGESSTDYTKLPHYDGVASRIHEFNLDAKIIYILRDPVERAISHYWWDVNWSGETRNMLEVVKKSEWIVNCSKYSMQLQAYMDLFPKSSVYVTTLEELKSTPETVLKNLFIWLDVAPFDIPSSAFEKRHNVSSEKVNMFLGGRLPWIKDSFLWKMAKKILPANIRTALLKLLSIKEQRYSEPEPAISYLLPVLSEDTRKLEALTRKKFDMWQKSN